MAARRLFLQLLNSQAKNSILSIDPCLKIASSWRSIFTRNDFLKKRQYSAAAGSHGIENAKSSGADSKPPATDKNPAVDITTVSNLKPSPRHDLAAMFTCKVCDTRSIKTFCRESYEKGVVVAWCGVCNNLHLLADRFGWFGRPGSIEDLLASRGEDVKKGSVDTLSLTLEDLAGLKLPNESDHNLSC